MYLSIVLERSHPIVGNSSRAVKSYSGMTLEYLSHNIRAVLSETSGASKVKLGTCPNYMGSIKTNIGKIKKVVSKGN